jgi:hypothetical protein
MEPGTRHTSICAFQPMPFAKANAMNGAPAFCAWVREDAVAAHPSRLGDVMAGTEALPEGVLVCEWPGGNKMSDVKIARWTGACGLAGIAFFLIEFPFYFFRGPFPTMAEAWKLTEYTARNDLNIMTCVLLDLIILGCLMVFTAGLRRVICRADARQEWLGTLFFGVGLVYTTLTLVADGLQAATVVDALTVPADATVIRTMLESMYLMYGSIALFLMALMMAVAGYAGAASGAMPAWTARVSYVCAGVCLFFVPSMLAGAPDFNGFYNPVGWGPIVIAASFPLAVWVIVTAIVLVRKREAAAPSLRKTA